MHAKHSLKAGLGLKKQTTKGVKAGKQRRLWRQKQIELALGEDLFDDDVEDTEYLDKDEEENDFGSEDNSEADEAEHGVEDEFSHNADASESFAQDENRHDADICNQLRNTFPAITFFATPDGILDYVVAERRELKTWRLLDRLARLLQERLSDRLLDAGAVMDRLQQTDLINRVEGGADPRDVSTLIHSTLICVQGRYSPASTYFRENVRRTDDARERAAQLLAQGMNKTDARAELEREFNARRTTALGWIVVAECRQMVRKCLSEGVRKEEIIERLVEECGVTEKVARKRLREVKESHDAES